MYCIDEQNDGYCFINYTIKKILVSRCNVNIKRERASIFERRDKLRTPQSTSTNRIVNRMDMNVPRMYRNLWKCGALCCENVSAAHYPKVNWLLIRLKWFCMPWWIARAIIASRSHTWRTFGEPVPAKFAYYFIKRTIPRRSRVNRASFPPHPLPANLISLPFSLGLVYDRRNVPPL